MIVGLTGRIASGKGQIVEFLKSKDFQYFTISQVVREEAAKKGIPIERKNLQDLGNEIRHNEGKNAWIKRLILKLDKSKNCIIDGIRNPGEIEELRKLDNFFLISVDAPQKVRFDRLLKRKKPSDPKTWEDFLEIDKRDFQEDDPLGQQVGKCMKQADFKIINDSDIDKLNKKIEEIFLIIHKKC